MAEDPLTVMQNLAIVNGRPCWQTQYMIARANKSGVFQGRITWAGEGRGDSLTVTASAVLADGGEVVSVAVSMAMAKADGWTKNPKYNSMPEHMLRWRSAAMLVRLYAPEVMLGIPTVEEEDAPQQAVLRDVTPAAPRRSEPAPSRPPRRLDAPTRLANPSPTPAPAGESGEVEALLEQAEADAALARTAQDLDEAFGSLDGLRLDDAQAERVRRARGEAEARLVREMPTDDGDLGVDDASDFPGDEALRAMERESGRGRRGAGREG